MFPIKISNFEFRITVQYRFEFLLYSIDSNFCDYSRRNFFLVQKNSLEKVKNKGVFAISIVKFD